MPRPVISRRLAILLRCTAFAAILTAAQPAEAQSVNLGIDLGGTLTDLLDRLTQTVPSNGGTPPDPANPQAIVELSTQLGGLGSVVSDLLGSNGVLADIGAELNSQNGLLQTQGALIQANVADIASLTVGLDQLRGAVGSGSGGGSGGGGGSAADLSALRATLGAHDTFLADHEAALEAHAAALASLRGTASAQAGDIGALRGGMAVQAEMVASHDAVLNAQGASLAALRGHVARQDAALADMNGMQADLAALDGRVRSNHAELSGRIDRVDRRVDTANEGVAMALAMKAPTVADDKTFALSGGWGTFEGENAFAVSGAVRATNTLQIDAGIAVGADRGSVGGRAGATVSW